jgi:excisionase family DNA binding protein
MKRLLTTREVAYLLGLSPETVLRRYRAGELPGVRLATNVLRFDEAALEAYVAARRGGPSTGPPATRQPPEVGCAPAEDEAGES